jgi:hypothetical protein
MKRLVFLHNEGNKMTSQKENDGGQCIIYRDSAIVLFDIVILATHPYGLGPRLN